MSTKAWEKFSLGKPATITFGENNDVNSWIKFRLLYDNSFAPPLGGASAMGTNTMALIQTCQIQAIMTVPERLSFPAQLSNCNLATRWHIELSILGLLHLSISIHLSNSFSCSMKFTTEKHWCPVSTFSYFHGKAFLGKPATITFGKNKDVKSWIKFRLLYDNSFAPALGGASAMGTNTMALIQTCQIRAIMTVPERLSFPAQLSNCNLATRWHIELSILGLLIQHAFEQRLKLFYQVLSFENKPWAGLGRILAVACANTEKYWCLQNQIYTVDFTTILWR